MIRSWKSSSSGRKIQIRYLMNQIMIWFLCLLKYINQLKKIKGEIVIDIEFEWDFFEYIDMKKE